MLLETSVCEVRVCVSVPVVTLVVVGVAVAVTVVEWKMRMLLESGVLTVAAADGT